MRLAYYLQIIFKCCPDIASYRSGIVSLTFFFVWESFEVFYGDIKR